MHRNIGFSEKFYDYLRIYADCLDEFISSYRYGFNGQEKDDEVSGKGNSYTAEFWQYDSRLGRRWNIDPLTAKYPWQSAYSTFNNNPIFFADPLGLEGEEPTTTEEERKRLDEKFGTSEDGVDLPEVTIKPQEPQNQVESKPSSWMRGASLKNHFGNGPSLGSEGKGVHYTDKSNPFYNDWMKGRAKHKSLEKFFMFYAGGSLAAPFAIAGAVTTAPVRTPYLAMGANGTVQVARVYDITFGVNGGYANKAWNYASQSYVTDNWGLQGKSATGLAGSGFLTYGTSIQGQIYVGAMDPWISMNIKGNSLVGTGYFTTSGYGPSIQKTTILSLSGLLAPLGLRVPLSQSPFINCLIHQGSPLLIQKGVEKSGQR